MLNQKSEKILSTTLSEIRGELRVQLEVSVTNSKDEQNRAWMCSPAIPVLERLRGEDCRFEASLEYMVRPHLKKQTKKWKSIFHRHFK
jgi:hypothetical protein